MTRYSVARVTGLNHRGEGVGRITGGPDEGLVVFIPGTLPGDLVEYSIVERKKNFMRGRVKKLLESGPGRVKEVCTVASRCGGCTWQHMEYGLQLTWKRRILEDALSRVAKITDCEIRDCLPSPRILNYRNKVEVPVAEKDGQVVAGFYEPYTHKVVPSEDCPLEHPLSREVVSRLLQKVREERYTAYNEVTGRGQVRHLISRVAPGTGERMAVIVAAIHRLPHESRVAREIMESTPGLVSVVLNVNTEKTNVILGDKERLLGGRYYIKDLFGDDELGRLVFRISPKSFYQVNSYQAVNLYKIALSAAGIGPRDLVYDVYSGIGTIALFAAKRSGFCAGIEEVGAAVRDARENARQNGIDNVVFREGKAERVLPEISADIGQPSVVILDPPRGGAEEGALRSIARQKPRAIVYVSCNPATLARDLLILKECGWYPRWSWPVDMFPMTPHVESVTLILPR